MKDMLTDLMEQFVLSLDVVHSGETTLLKELLQSYFRKIGIEHYLVCLAGPKDSNHKEFLDALWTNGNNDLARIQEGDGLYSGLSYHAYQKNTELWITARDKQPLPGAPPELLIDQWKNQSDLPKFWDFFKDKGIKTSIILPLAAKDRPIGFIALETKKHLVCSAHAKARLERLARIVSTLAILHQVSDLQRANSIKAFSQLRHTVSTAPEIDLSKPKLFFAFPEGRGRVVETVMDALREFEEQFSVVPWDRLIGTQIGPELLKEIESCSYAICYFSEFEERKSLQHQYRDNSNVLYEAGMIQALTRHMFGTPEDWIPIREKHSPELPFDLDRLRIMNVPRDNDGKLDEQALILQIKERIVGWF